MATGVCRHAGAARGTGPRGAAASARGRVSMTAPSTDPRPPPPPDWPAAVCCPVAKAMPVTDWWGAGGGGEGAGFAACPRRAEAVSRGAGAARSRSEREGGGRAALSHVPIASRRRSHPPRGLGAARAARGSALGARPAHAACVRAAELAALRARRFRPVGSCSSPR